MKTIILAAGKGSRLKSEETHTPKVLRKACGRPLLSYVISALPPHDDDDIYLVIGYEKEKVIKAFPRYHHVVQEELLGTGHAVLCAKEVLKDYDGELIEYSKNDADLEDSIDAMIEHHRKLANACTLLSCRLPKDTVLGRIMRDENGRFTEIVENAECTPEQKKIHEYNTATYIFDAKLLFPALDIIVKNSTKREIYLTDVPELLLKQGYKVDAIPCKYPYEIYGVNTEADLALVEKTMMLHKLV
jgi:bifunctional UDP-N-acetylglucosamine pyrophosphorylase/glucosamine-1-phosphate N-acetyltransferase/UDP-N-acetylglucosamine pyrophosphorylase